MTLFRDFIARRWPAYILLVVAMLLLAFGYFVRGESPGRVLAAFGSILWFAQVSGGLILLLLERRGGGDRLRFVLLANAIGLALIPVLYVLVRTAGFGEQYVLIHSLLNLALAGAVLVRGKGKGIMDWRITPVASPTLYALSILVLVVAGSVLVRELLQFYPGHLVISSSQEVDAGYFIGMIVGLRDFGSLVDMNAGGGPMHYHYFVILFMAIVSRASGAEALTVFQAVFPPYLFLLLALSVFWATRQISRSTRTSLLAGVLILFLNDLSVFNTIIATLTRRETLAIVYATLNIANLHLSLSWLVSIGMLMILMGELRRLEQRPDARLMDFVPFLFVISVLAGYKVPTWMCLAGGMGLASLLMVGRRPLFLLASVLAVCGGAGVLLGMIGVSEATSAFGEIYIGYPLLNNDGVRQLAGLSRYKVTLDTMTPGIGLLILLLIPFWLLLTYGVRSVWLARSIAGFSVLRREGRFMEMSILCGILIGVTITIAVVPSTTPWIVYYYSLFGLVATTPFTAVVIHGYLVRWRGIRRLVLVGLVVLQMASGFMYVVRPLLQKKHIADLDGPWLQAMRFLRERTEPDAVLASNRMGFSSDPVYADYNERFYFVPAFAERVVAVSGSKYHLATDPRFHRRRKLFDSMFSTNNPVTFRMLADSLAADYIVFDRWQGDSLAGVDPQFFDRVYSNTQIDIYQVRRDPVTRPVGSDSTTSSQR